MFRSRVLTSPDVARFADAISRPGIDPRVWVSYAILLSDPFVETSQGQQDVFVDVLLLPQNQPETARVGAVYAGNGFGLYAPLHKDDEVLVCAPSGDPDEGLVVTQRMWSPSDNPPAAAVDFPEDFLLIVEEGRSARIAVAGGGKVYLGTTDASRGVARLDDEVNIGTKTVTVTLTTVPPAPPAGTITTVIKDAKGTTISSETLPYPPAIPPDLPGVYVTQLYGKVSSASETVVSA